VIGVAELMRTAQLAGNLTFQYVPAYSMAGLYYVLFVIVIQTISHQVERKLSRRAVRRL
jgi:ABC-type amino acid transport system permease subunit